MKMMQIFATLLLGLAQLSSCEMSNLRGALQKDFGETVLRELEEALGSIEHREQTEQKLHEFEAELRTTFKALPKNSRGALDGPNARYALHRLFTQRYGWQVKGLEMTSAGAGVGMVGDLVPLKMREAFEKRLGSHGLLLHELAMLAATLDAMFRKDVQDRLRVVYAALGYNESDTLVFNKAFHVAHAYMSALVIGNPVEELHEADVRLSDDAFVAQERHGEIQDLLRSTMWQVAGDGPESFEWKLMVSWLLEFGKQVGHHEDKECQVMKNSLLPWEAAAGTGRVRLPDFYKASDAFEEDVKDLRSMEALDETDPDDPKVIIPNYLQGTTNCINPAGYYSICCFDECEALMDKIEVHFEAPVAKPSAIASFVASLPSASQPANRSLVPELLEVLELLAMDHGGTVPLHSKKFAHWMHQAYPWECSHPQQSNADRFNQSLRYLIDELKAEHSKTWGMPHLERASTQKMRDEPYEQSHSRSVASEICMTCIMGFVGTLLAKVFLNISKRSQGKAAKEI